ncbi:MAG: type II toxin-antitoxin system RelE/ParE family toxin [Erythrobacter sp.]|uniref:type II toxin-antitoxin system RelE/ParE family toxin n=1 Tax=Erythrobacter sp. TaxID=1042 RepID=UPI0025E93C36|nr:type II toxin-antitoxin system RelE/ParE family toxin [Erythrobacter sp.]MCM0000986.1 type II toxin-antitoxin system RelE/ParE family toxin [Erythrobacter sp.]
MNFDFTPDAQVDLLDIGETIARDNPERAASYVAELLDRTAQIACQPTLYRLRPEWGTAVRSARFGSYLILFEMSEEGVTILRYLHGRRDIGTLMPKEPE